MWLNREQCESFNGCSLALISSWLLQHGVKVSHSLILAHISNLLFPHSQPVLADYLLFYLMDIGYLLLTSVLNERNRVCYATVTNNSKILVTWEKADVLLTHLTCVSGLMKYCIHHGHSGTKNDRISPGLTSLVVFQRGRCQKSSRKSWTSY